jgi:signal transduction histidine kinase
VNRGIVVRTELAANLPVTTADRVQLQQLVLNLVMNGMDALLDTTGHKEIVISTRENGNAEIAVSVEDSGPGLTPELAEKIFDPFFTTKPHGIGLGLSISRSIAEAHAGKLWVEPRPHGGAIFRLTLPIQPQATNA